MTDVRLTWPHRHPPDPPEQHELTTLLQIPSSRPNLGHARLLAGQAIAVLDRLLQEGLGGQVDLIYLDPPFGAGVTWPRRRDIRTGTGTQALQVEAYPDPDQDWHAWLQHLDTVLDRAHRLLSPRGSLYVHLDFRRAPHARLLADERFGISHFRNEIIWSYGLGGSSKDRFGRKHDVILFYARDPKQQYFVVQKQAATSNRLAGKSKGATDVWQTTDRDGDAQIDGTWQDDLIAGTLSNTDAQRTGYPTQKPLALLERIVQASLPPGGLALDPMAGSGTLGVAAVKLGGRAILGDRSLVALDASRGRLVQAGAAVQLQALDAHVRWQTLPRPGAHVKSGQATLQTLDLTTKMGVHGQEALSAWGVLDANGQTLAWWDGGAARVRTEIPLTLEVMGKNPQFWAGIDLEGQLWRSELS